MSKKEKLRKLNKRKVVLFKELFEAEENKDIKSINAELTALERKIRKLG